MEKELMCFAPILCVICTLFESCCYMNVCTLVHITWVPIPALPLLSCQIWAGKLLFPSVYHWSVLDGSTWLGS